MFCKFYGFTEKPFNIVPNPGFLYESKRHRQALTYLRYGFTENIGFILFTGEIGTGKTTLLKYLLKKISAEVEVAVVFNTNVNAEELLRLILIELEVEGICEDKSKNLDILNDHLIDIYKQGRRCLLIIDEAQNLSADALEEVRLLSNLQTDTHPLLQIILAGQPELREIIQSPGLEQLAQRVAINYHLTPLSRDELGEYVQYRLRKVGCNNGDLFSAEAIDLIYEHSGGVPRTVNVICNAALVYGYADSLKEINVEIIEQVLSDNIGVISRTSKDESVHYATTGVKENSLESSALKRISSLESQVAKLTAKVNWQSGQVDGAIAQGNNKLVESLSEMIEMERNRSEQYYGRSIAQFQKNKILQSKLDELLNDNERSFGEKGKPKKKGFFKNLFSSMFTG